ncbi:MAG: hypothetical protein NTZ72_03755, partial [Afipia sp.]|nr:hypothetical protein [Afipia sp.]
ITALVVFGIKFHLEKTIQKAPDVWITIPAPPMMSDVVGDDFQSTDEKFQELLRKRTVWQTVVSQVYGASNSVGIDLPYLGVDTFFENGLTNSDEGIQSIRRNREKLFVRFRTKSLQGDAARRFVETVKGVITECRAP